MMRISILLLISLFFNQILAAQATENSWKYPVEQGRIFYEYTGNTEGHRELFFRNFGEEQVVFTNLARTSTFFSVQTTTPENVIEIKKEGLHYHFDLESKKGLIIDFPIHLLHKYFRLPDTKSYQEGFLAIGAQLEGEEEILGYNCEIWTFRGRKVWVWNNLILKMKSTGLNKNFSMEAIQIDLQHPIPEEKFSFPDWYID